MTAETRVRTQAIQYWICGEERGIVTGVLPSNLISQIFTNSASATDAVWSEQVAA
jgi:hypothetical protein